MRFLIGGKTKSAVTSESQMSRSWLRSIPGFAFFQWVPGPVSDSSQPRFRELDFAHLEAGSRLPAGPATLTVWQVSRRSGCSCLLGEDNCSSVTSPCFVSTSSLNQILLSSRLPCDAHSQQIHLRLAKLDGRLPPPQPVTSAYLCNSLGCF